MECFVVFFCSLFLVIQGLGNSVHQIFKIGGAQQFQAFAF